MKAGRKEGRKEFTSIFDREVIIIIAYLAFQRAFGIISRSELYTISKSYFCPFRA